MHIEYTCRDAIEMNSSMYVNSPMAHNEASVHNSKIYIANSTEVSVNPNANEPLPETRQNTIESNANENGSHDMEIDDACSNTFDLNKTLESNSAFVQHSTIYIENSAEVSVHPNANKSLPQTRENIIDSNANEHGPRDMEIYGICTSTSDSNEKLESNTPQNESIVESNSVVVNPNRTPRKVMNMENKSTNATKSLAKHLSTLSTKHFATGTFTSRCYG